MIRADWILNATKYSCKFAKRKYREPDKLKNAKQELRRIIPTYQPIDGAKKITAHMDVDNNTSHSFKVFVRSIRKMAQA